MQKTNQSKSGSTGPKTGNRPPAYPQVETIQEVQSNQGVFCRFCKEQIDGDIWGALSKKQVMAIRSGTERIKWTHTCGNVVKIIMGSED